MWRLGTAAPICTSRYATVLWKRYSITVLSRYTFMKNIIDFSLDNHAHSYMPYFLNTGLKCTD